MKKILIVVLLLSMTSLVYGDIDTFVGQTGIDTWVGQTGVDTVVGQTIAAGGACAQTLVDENAADDVDGNWFFGSSATLYLAQQFQASESYTVCEARLHIRLNSGDTPNFTVTAQIWSNDNNETAEDNTDDTPGSIIGSGSDTNIDVDVDCTEDYAWENVTWNSGPSVTSGTIYWLVWVASNADGTDYCQVSYGDDETSPDNEEVRSDADGTDWNGSTNGSNRAINYGVYK